MGFSYSMSLLVAVASHARCWLHMWELLKVQCLAWGQKDVFWTAMSCLIISNKVNLPADVLAGKAQVELITLITKAWFAM